MVSFGQLRDAKPAMWLKAASGWAAEAKRAESCANDIRAKGAGALDEHWVDRVGISARSSLVDLANKFESAADEMRGAVMVIDALAESISLAQGVLCGAIELARQKGLRVSADGALRPMPGGVPSPADVAAVKSRLDEALREATQADRKSAIALKRIQDSIAITDPARAVNDVQVAASHDQMAILAGDIPVGKDPVLVAGWWNSLSYQQQQQIMLAEPTLIAGLNGILQSVKSMLYAAENMIE